MGLPDDVSGLFVAAGQRLGVKDATLIKVTPGTRMPGSVSAGTNPTETSYPCKGFVSRYAAERIDGTLILAGDRKICLFASTIGVGIEPKTDDKITIEGTTFRVITVARDPASVMFRCQSRK